jgi:hypothetical protein
MCSPQGRAQQPAPRSPHVSAPPKKADEALIVLARNADYFEFDPVYRLMIYADGRVVYIGSKNVKRLGMAEGRISPEQLQRLVKAFENINYFSLLDEYSGKAGCPFYMADGPSAHIFFRADDKRKSVFHDSGCMKTKKPRLTSRLG